MPNSHGLKGRFVVSYAPTARREGKGSKGRGSGNLAVAGPPNRARNGHRGPCGPGQNTSCICVISVPVSLVARPSNAPVWSNVALLYSTVSFSTLSIMK